MADEVIVDVSVLIEEITDSNFELIKLALRTLGKKYSKFDTLKIYESEKKFEVITSCKSKQYMTRTYIGRYKWVVLESYCKVAGEEEIQIFKR